MPLLGKQLFWGISQFLHMPSVKREEVQPVSHIMKSIHIKYVQTHRKHKDFARTPNPSPPAHVIEQWWKT